MTEAMQLRQLGRVALLLADIEDGLVELRLVRDANAAALFRFEFLTTDGSTRLLVSAPGGNWGYLLAVRLPNGETVTAVQLRAMGFADYAPSANTAVRAYGLVLA